ncbi:ribonucleoside hydrolase [Virgibacillus halodenitrificans]|uniref:nucleoside hydrolase n=1 Tax=Virgibacillus halodenitrificans TaxID=1482 RepID=UPI00136CD74F|nr:nucleoside hydrolase [Virgibacillus halodenitrificans]MYL47107.1 ribonucleoside hydrolase [Virgibacillus halodenitrificans]WHX26228.1 nucleoside hydrolase [Virgibacillus halodenitrificans]
MNKKVILDCDPGHDDAISIIIAAAKTSNLKIEAITTVAGNVEVEKNTLNALKVCDIIGLDDVPVAQGAGKPLTNKMEIAEEIHGETGLDGPLLPEIPSKKPVDQHAVDLIIEKVMESDDDITLVPTGPLTNIALAMIREPAIVPKIKEIVLMGGGTFGNWTPAAEFNIYVDAEAAKVVFESGVPITMFGLDVTHQALATTQTIEDLSVIDNDVAKFVVDLLKFFMKTYKEFFDFDGGPIHDACTVAYLIDPSIFEMKHVHVDIETKGEYTYGMTCVDMLGVTGKETNVNVAYQLDQKKFWDLFYNALSSYTE